MCNLIGSFCRRRKVGKYSNTFDQLLIYAEKFGLVGIKFGV